MFDGIFIRRGPHRRGAQRHGRGSGGVPGCSGAPDAGFRQSWPLAGDARVHGRARAPAICASSGAPGWSPHPYWPRPFTSSALGPDSHPRHRTRLTSHAVSSRPPLLYAAQAVQSPRGQRRPLHASSRHFLGAVDQPGLRRTLLERERQSVLARARIAMTNSGAAAEGLRLAEVPGSVEIAWNEQLMSCDLFLWPSHRCDCRYRKLSSPRINREAPEVLDRAASGVDRSHGRARKHFRRRPRSKHRAPRLRWVARSA